MADNDNNLNRIVQTLKNFVSTIVDVDSALSGVNRQAGQFDEKYSDFIINACQNSEELTGSILEMGDAVKVLSMRMRGMKDELQALGEEYENVKSVYEIQSLLLKHTNGSVNLFDDTGNLQSTYNIIKSISDIWDHISQTDQTAILGAIAGDQRSGQSEALIRSFQRGSSPSQSLSGASFDTQALERQMSSLDSTVQHLKDSFRSLSSAISSTDVRGFVSAIGGSDLSILDRFIDTVGAKMPNVIEAGIIKTISNFGRLCNTSRLKFA